MHLGILDQMPRPRHLSVEETVEETIHKVQMAEEWGYERYWFAEHHGTKGMTSSAPEILMATAAAKTKTIHVGSGGILLSQYSPYKVATQMLQLQSIFPGRIEAGVGRSPGGPERIRKALANGVKNETGIYPEKIKQMLHYFAGDQSVQATPRPRVSPQLYSLGLGENSAQLAAELGIGYVFGHFIQSGRGVQAHKQYREYFQPGFLVNPKAITAVFVICGATDEDAEEMAITQDIWLLRTEKGIDSRIPTLEEAKAMRLTTEDKKRIALNRKRMIIGGPAKVKEELSKWSELYECDHWLLLNNTYHFADQRQSYERIAEMFF
ncbi:LLM class flavin-dependent oxidoreductase [Cytobacillus sp. FSL W7-1323]|uniref:LLM class flavin-dependent oxidoreductase n=1 Tax=unclassified Cytobacillus TaxID=2675268 RepID=UPI002AFE92A4|nr:LLM class flavin-dependent oxidoreductase [Cytobacillus sp. OWB-43]MEA1854895.1 LLM class flavin-dependent oxidoreductase [Cytobacillus sp. OWB-43]